MDLSLYKPVDLEKWINRTYQANGIYYPEDLEIEVIAELFKIDLQFYNGPSFADYPEGEYPVIFLNAYGDNKRRRAEFFHELCHPLRHMGDQEELAPTFKQLQEAQAELFQLYASLPIYMIEPFVQDCYTYAALIKTLSEAFTLPEALVQKRTDQIQNRIYLKQQEINLERQRAERRAKIEGQSFEEFLEENNRRFRERFGA